MAAIVAIAVMLHRANGAMPLSALELVVVGFAALSVAVTFASGGWVSAIEKAPTWVLWIHRTAPYLAVALSSAIAYFALGPWLTRRRLDARSASLPHDARHRRSGIL